jgi:hypothetical protein
VILVWETFRWRKRVGKKQQELMMDTQTDIYYWQSNSCEYRKYSMHTHTHTHTQTHTHTPTHPHTHTHTPTHTHSHSYTLSQSISLTRTLSLLLSSHQAQNCFNFFYFSMCVWLESMYIVQTLLCVALTKIRDICDRER